MYFKNIIIGSGPAGMSAASEILQNGKNLQVNSNLNVITALLNMAYVSNVSIKARK